MRDECTPDGLIAALRAHGVDIGETVSTLL